MAWRDRIRDWITSPQPLKKGIYHYRGGLGDQGQVRLHLRVEDDGRGILVINAARVLHLNQTATEYAKLILEGKTADQVVRTMTRRYQVDEATARADYDRLYQVITTITSTDEVCPVTYLDVERIEPFATPVSAPYRMDLALTYRCDNDCGHCYVGRPKNTPEMTTDQWRAVLDRVWTLGIPHVCFTGGEATLRPDLRDLIAHAEDLGLVTGLLTNGRRLSDRAYLDGLLSAGLDHVQITIESHDPAIHNEMVCANAWDETVASIRNAVAADVYVTTNTTLTTRNIENIEETVAFLAELGVHAFACNGLIYSGKGKEVGTGIREEDLAPILNRIQEAASRHNLRLIWYTPTQYCQLHPVNLELGVKGCTAAKYNMCVEPDGQVIPCQSYYQSLGHILHDPWEKIWDSELARSLREHTWVPEKCTDCEDLPLCGGGCPLYGQQESVVCVESKSSAG